MSQIYSYVQLLLRERHPEQEMQTGFVLGHTDARILDGKGGVGLVRDDPSFPREACGFGCRACA